MYLFHVLFINQFHVSLVERMLSGMGISCQVFQFTLGGILGLKCGLFKSETNDIRKGMTHHPEC